MEHLKKIDAKIVEEKVQNTKIEFDKQNDDADFISIDKISAKYNIPREAASKILAKKYPEHIMIKQYLISKAKTNTIRDSLEGISKFVEACKVLTAQAIPESCHADLLSKLGYDVVWTDLDPNNAEIILK